MWIVLEERIGVIPLEYHVGQTRTKTRKRSTHFTQRILYDGIHTFVRRRNEANAHYEVEESLKTHAQINRKLYLCRMINASLYSELPDLGLHRFRHVREIAGIRFSRGELLRKSITQLTPKINSLTSSETRKITFTMEAVSSPNMTAGESATSDETCNSNVVNKTATSDRLNIY